ncbi:MAG: sigma 54-interacting transcriptional regulator [Byssovorax sp.]
MTEPDDGSRRPIGVVTHVLCYDDLTRGDAARAPLLRRGGVEKIVIGRAPEGDHVLRIADDCASRAHAQVWCGASRDVITDLGGKNGTLVNGAPISGETSLDDGDFIEVGSTLLVYRRVDEGTAALLERKLELRLGPTKTLAPAAMRVAVEIERIAETDASVLLLGETGTGKDVAARQIHQRSKRTGDFVAVNCAAIPETLAEAELFGHVPGAHHGAARSRPGYILSADKGTLFFDEVGDMPEAVQVKLLRVLQDRLVTPLGSDRPRLVDVRWLAATNAEVNEESSQLRRDLYARLAERVITLPRLRDRREDLGILAAHLLTSLTAPPGRTLPRAITRRAAWALFTGDLPLNVRGLFDVLKGAALVCSKERMDLADFSAATLGLRGRTIPPRAPPPEPSSPSSSAAAAPPRNRRPEASVIEAALQKRSGVVGLAAADLGIHERQLRRWMRELGVVRPIRARS